MPYSKLSKRILAGSVNLLPPGDLIPAEDARQMQNFRVDQAGNLRSRHGSRSLVPVPLAGSDIHTLAYRAGASPAFYQGVGPNLFRDLSVQIATGFDGQPLGIAASQKFAWIMNRAKRGKDNGSTFMNWQPDPPASAPTLTVGAEERKTIANFESGETWVTANELASPTPYFDTTDKVQGATSLRFVTDAAGNPRAELPFTVDLGIDGKQRDDDVSKIWIWLLDPTSVDAVTLMVDVNDGTFTQDYYVATIPREKFNEAGQTWNEIEILRALPEDDVSGRLAFMRFGATPGKDWSTTAKVRVQADFNTSGQVKFDEWTFAGGLKGFLKGEGRYYITFDTAEGHESNPSPPTEFKSFDNQGATLNSIPTSPDSQVTMRHIYRETDALGGAFRVATINENTSTGPWADVYPDDLVTDLNVPLEKDHDPPPPARGVVGEYYNRLLAYSSAEFPARMWWTKPNRPWYFPGSDEKDADNFTDVGDHGEELLAISPHKRWAGIFKQFSIWRLVGDPDDGQLEQADTTMGMLGALAWTPAGAVDYIASESGIYRFNSENLEKVSQRIEPIFKGETAEITPGILVLPMDRQYSANALLFYAQGRLFFSYPELGQQFPSQTLVYDIDSGRWSTYLLPSGLQQRGFRSLLRPGSASDLVAGDTSGVVFSFESLQQPDSNVDRGISIPLAYHSGYQDVGLGDNEKLFADLEIEHNTGLGAAAGSALTVKLFYNNGASEEAIGTIRSSTRTKDVFSVNAGAGKEAYNAAVRIEGNASTLVAIYAIYLHYYPLPRKAKNYDSDVQDAGTFLVKQFDQMEIEIDSTAAVTWKFSTDVPSGVMTQRSTGSFVATNGRKTVNLRAPDFPLVEGKRFRITLTCPDGLFRLFDLKVRVKPIGEYIDGAAGEFWESSEVGYA